MKCYFCKKETRQDGTMEQFLPYGIPGVSLPAYRCQCGGVSVEDPYLKEHIIPAIILLKYNFYYSKL